eukprot:6210145-Pleurochrysis_carterae.AAC.1
MPGVLAHVNKVDVRVQKLSLHMRKPIQRRLRVFLHPRVTRTRAVWKPCENCLTHPHRVAPDLSLVQAVDELLQVDRLAAVRVAGVAAAAARSGGGRSGVIPHRPALQMASDSDHIENEQA